ncbi:MAG: hypothetical protein U0807_10215 [Candidatus Binatia bacterium]
MRRGIILVALTALAGALEPTWGAVFCQKKSGAVFLRDTCKKKETAVDLATLGAVGPTGPTGQDGTPGTPGAAGSAKAYAYVDSTGAVAPSRSLHITAAKEGTGEYCIKVDGVTPQNIIAMPEDFGSPPHQASGDIGGLGSCSSLLPGTNAFVVIRKVSDASLEDANFFVMAN